MRRAREGTGSSGCGCGRRRDNAAPSCVRAALIWVASDAQHGRTQLHWRSNCSSACKTFRSPNDVRAWRSKDRRLVGHLGYLAIFGASLAGYAGLGPWIIAVAAIALASLSRAEHGLTYERGRELGLYGIIDSVMVRSVCNGADGQRCCLWLWLARADHLDQQPILIVVAGFCASARFIAAASLFSQPSFCERHEPRALWQAR